MLVSVLSSPLMVPLSPLDPFYTQCSEFPERITGLPFAYIVYGFAFI